MLINEGKCLQVLRKDLAEIEVESFNVEDFVDFTPDQQEQPKDAAVEADLEDFLDKV